MKTTTVSVKLNDDELRKLNVLRLVFGTHTTKSELLRLLIVERFEATQRKPPLVTPVELNRRRNEGQSTTALVGDARAFPRQPVHD